ncbi:MAG TPA: zinc-dependent metalloprotease, partial [Myxococcaceae bacterium]|nr:zinc-dependent metalloprotease [Myxococcaceae bacterium]
MDRTYTRWLAAAAALIAAGCAQSNGDLSYVQPNYLKKSDLLDGVWYFRNTVTDTPATTGFTFPGETGELEKIVWDVQENHLLGYRSYPQIPGQDGRIEDASRPSGTTTQYCENGGCSGGHRYYGSPVVAFPIEKHFDIQRGYSPSTGEQTNVISENAIDRPWNEREYIRVNWTAETMNVRMGAWGMVGPGGASDLSSWIYANQEGTDPYDWPRQEYEAVDGRERLKYFEFTARYLARPDTLDYPGYGTVPFCWLSERYDCTAQEILVRSSIARVDPKQTLDYEPLVYDNAMMAKFGYFRTERLNYDRRFGFNESDILYLANRHRIWKASYQRGAGGNVDWTKPIPLPQREPKPIVFYVPPASRMGGVDEHRQYLEATRDLEAGWDKAFRRAVAAAQGKGDDWQSVRKMVYVCENPVPRGVAPECGAEGFEARFGDLRYNFLWTIAEAVPNGLLGYGPWSADPETGEIISANANTYSATVALQAQHTLDIVNVLSGDFSIEDIIRGDDVRRYMLSHPAYASALQRSGRLEAELQGSSVERTGAPLQGAFLRPTDKQRAAMNLLSASGGLPVGSGDRMRAAADRLAQHPQLESAILDNPDLQQVAMGLMPTDVALAADVRPDDAREALRGVLLRPQEMLQLHRARIDYASRRNIHLVDFYENRQMVALALREKNWRTLRIAELMAPGAGRSPEEARAIADDELRWRFRRHIWRATSEHEVGHTFGLRHNFQGSFDAINYFDRYWELRKPTLSVDQTVNSQTTAVVPATPGDLHAVSSGTLDQLYGGLHDHEYSSIMDYGGRTSADWQGVGKYDEAAIIFAYSGSTSPGYVEVFDAPLRTDTKSFDTSNGQTIAITGAGYDLPVINAARINTAVPNYTERFHYSTVPLHLGSGQTLQQVIDDGVLTLRRRRLMKWSEVEAKTRQLRELLRVKPVPTAAEVSAIGVPPEVPYMFCTEGHVGAVLSCQ